MVPDGAVLAIDEIQDIWPARKTGSPIPEAVKQMAQIRHRGITLIFTSQFNTQLDTNIRYLVKQHIVLKELPSTAFGKRIKWLEWNDYQPNPRDYHAQKEALVNKTLKIKKTYFNWYTSASSHHVKTGLPLKLYLWLALIVACICWGIYVVFFMIAPDKKDSNSASTVSQLQDAVTSGFNSTRANTGYSDSNLFDDKSTYIKAITPVITDKPDTAPIYTALHEAVSKPIKNCLVIHRDSGNECRCYSQQATILSISDRQCFLHVRDGYEFDYTKPDITDSEGTNYGLSTTSEPLELDELENVPYTPNLSTMSRKTSVRHPASPNL
ncbi:zonular occludens toxin Zot [Arenicella xantha]|uniref:Zonular occludens toxin Zot n=1 Tax=Arenicella xantha TaxID=644221 RepID=A0A395JI29_9GAMM|nr:zonular occludens toxin Zot [Arenicella xantha]